MSTTNEQPIPQGKYLAAVRNADLIYTSGMTPRKSGKLLYSGKIQMKDPIDSNRESVRLATSNALTAAMVCLKEGEKISLILQLTVYLNTEDGFTAHAKIADFASEYLIETLGANSIGSRAAIGVASLPSNAPVEISLVGQVVSSN
jgi:enamine deaminase RidA (YjgF/YER057c/UK114 family)